MRRFTAVLSLCVLSATPAAACWRAPSVECFESLWAQDAQAFVQSGPRIARLHDLIGWSATPPGAEAAKALLGDLTYERLEEHAEQIGVGEPDAYYVAGVYDLVLQTKDAASARAWYAAIPAILRVGGGIAAPEGAPPGAQTPAPNQGFHQQATGTVLVLETLHAGRIDEAASLADNLGGEPRFLAWKALARRAIEEENWPLLRRAVLGMTTAFHTSVPRDDSSEAFDLAVQAAERELARTGDPDALVAALESAGETGAVRDDAWIAIALAERILSTRSGEAALPGWAFEKVLQGAQAADDSETVAIALMRNARTAWRLGYRDEARMMIDVAFEHPLSVPSFGFWDIPEQRSDWAEGWLDEMLRRFDDVRTRPEQYSERRYWSTWVDQDALDAAHRLTIALSRYRGREAARAFAEDAAQYLSGLAQRYASELQDPVPFDQFLADVSPWIYDAETVVALRSADPERARRGERMYGIAQDLARAGQIEAAKKLISEADQILNFGFWMQHAFVEPPEARDAYVDWLDGLIRAQAVGFADSYPMLRQELLKDAAIFMARLGRWDDAERYFSQIVDEEGKYGPSSAARARLQVYKAIVTEVLGARPKLEFDYPYEDYAL